MDLLKYLEPMKNLPKRFSNLAFWRDMRKFKDDVVNAFEYVDSWGDTIEHKIDSVTKTGTTSTTLKSVATMKNSFKVATYSDLSWIEIDVTKLPIRVSNDIKGVDVLSATLFAELNLGDFPSITVTLPVVYTKGAGFSLDFNSIIRIPLPVKIAQTYVPSAIMTICYTYK